jgi:hypothetical protein
MSILLVAAAAVLAGARSFTAIGEWAADAPQHVLKTLGIRRDLHHGRYQAPDEATLRRALQAIDGDLLDTAIAVDGQQFLWRTHAKKTIAIFAASAAAFGWGLLVAAPADAATPICDGSPATIIAQPGV